MPKSAQQKWVAIGQRSDGRPKMMKVREGEDIEVVAASRCVPSKNTQGMPLDGNNKQRHKKPGCEPPNTGIEPEELTEEQRQRRSTKNWASVEKAQQDLQVHEEGRGSTGVMSLLFNTQGVSFHRQSSAWVISLNILPSQGLVTNTTACAVGLTFSLPLQPVGYK